MKVFRKIVISSLVLANASQLTYAKQPIKKPSKMTDYQICLANKTVFNQQSRSNFTGEMRTLVRVAVNSKVIEIKLLKPSDDKALNTLVTQSIYQANYPFKANNLDLKEITEFRIVRTWQFKQGKLLNNVC